MKHVTRLQKHKRRHPGPCFYCQNGRLVSYRDVLHLKRFLTRRGKIRSCEETGLCAQHQRQMARAVKRARVMALLPFSESRKIR